MARRRDVEPADVVEVVDVEQAWASARWFALGAWDGPDPEWSSAYRRAVSALSSSALPMRERYEQIELVADDLGVLDSLRRFVAYMDRCRERRSQADL